MTWPFFTTGVEVDQQLLDLARDLAADLDGGDGVEVAGGRHGGGEGAALDAGESGTSGALPRLWA